MLHFLLSSAFFKNFQCLVKPDIMLVLCYRAWECISHNVRKQGSLLVTVPSLEESLSGLQVCKPSSHFYCQNFSSTFPDSCYNILEMFCLNIVTDARKNSKNLWLKNSFVVD